MSQQIAITIDPAQLRTSCADCGLVSLCLPAAIGLDEMARLDTLIAERCRLEVGRVLYRQGASATALHVVRAGAFKSVVSNDDGTFQIIGFHYPGELLGLDALGGGLYGSTAQALERSNACVVSYEGLLRIAAQIPALQRQLMRVVGREIVHDHERLVTLGSTHAVQRLASFLLSLCDRYRRLQRDPSRLRLPMSRADLANYLGLAIETVCRQFGRLAVGGVIEVQSRAIRVLDFEALERLCHEPQPDGDFR